MAIGNRKRLEILLIVSIIVNCSIVFLQLYSKNEQGVKSRIEILRTVNRIDHEEFMHPVRVNEKNNYKDAKEARASKLVEKLEESRNEKTDHLHVQQGTKGESLKQNDGNHLNSFGESRCPEGGEALDGQKKVDLNELVESVHTIDSLAVENGGKVEYGGWWEPQHCKPRAKVAIMLPYRNRELQLKTFLLHTHPILQRQLLAYRIFLIEQVGRTQWNKGSIYNIGFNKTLSIDNYDCHIFHDIDLLLENDKNYYGCPVTPAHLSVAVNTLKYRLPYRQIFGGVEALKKEEFTKINGFSNMFWGWGGEDDDLYTRVINKGYKVFRPPKEVARYTMNKDYHFVSDGINRKNQEMYRDAKSRIRRINIDGLNRIDSLNYSITTQSERLFTRISINLRRL